MEQRGSHIIDVNIGLEGVRINSEFADADPQIPKTKNTDRFGSIEDARKKLDSLYKMYDRFLKGYSLLAVTQVGGILVDAGKGASDLLSHKDPAFGNDMLFMIAIIGATVFTFTAAGFADENKLKTKNKLSAVRRAEGSGELHFRDIYPL